MDYISSKLRNLFLSVKEGLLKIFWGYEIIVYKFKRLKKVKVSRSKRENYISKDFRY